MAIYKQPTAELPTDPELVGLNRRQLEGRVRSLEMQLKWAQEQLNGKIPSVSASSGSMQEAILTIAQADGTHTVVCKAPIQGVFAWGGSFKLNFEVKVE